VLDTYDGSNFLIFISSSSLIASFDLNKEKIYNPNMNYLEGVSFEEQETVLNSLPIRYKPSDNVVGNIANSRMVLGQKRATTVANESEATLIGEDGSRYLEKRIGLSVLIGTLKQSTYTGDPWVLMEKFANSGLPESVSDYIYSTMIDEDKEKYKIHPKLTVQYAWDTQGGKDFAPESNISHDYIDLYVDEFTPTTPGTFKIYHNGSEISKSAYFRYSDELRKECNIYKVTTINYKFVRLSFNNEGTGMYDEEFSSRLTGNKSVYAFYYKEGVEVDEHYGYKIKLTENIVNGSDTIYSDNFGEYLLDSKNKDSEFSKIKKIPGWKLVSKYTDYTENVVSSLPILENITKIYPINGYVEASTGVYTHHYIISDGYRAQLIRVSRGTIYVSCEYNFEDNNELVNVKSIDDDIKVYLIYKNQRIVILETYEYVPSEYSIPRMDTIKFFVETDNPKKDTSISYVTSDDRVVNISLNTLMYFDNPTHFYDVKDSLQGNIVSLINCVIHQTEPFRYISNNRVWHTLEGNDKTKLIEAQIN
jgi:hypothetical protein